MYNKYIPAIRLENGVAMITFLATYQYLGYEWRTFAYWFLVPDIAILAYLLNPRIGAYCYNFTHSYIGPAVAILLLTLLSTATNHFDLTLIWVAHIAMDRSLGFGLKSTASFYDTHLGKVKINGHPREDIH